MTIEIQTVTGTTTPEKLGRTLMHEHLLIGYPGSDVDWVNPGPSRRERVERCVERIEEMKALGITAMLDPCPSDLGRDVELMAEVAQRTRFQLICATGLYKEAEGATAYWKFKMNFGSAVDAMAELFIRELTEGVAGTGIRAGIIKVGTGHGTLTPYEQAVFEAAAKASLAAMQLGVCDRALRMTASYTSTREQFGRKIATFQAVGQRAANAYIDVECLRLVVQHAVWLLGEERPASEEVAVAKIWAGDTGHRVSFAAQHLHGGMGVDVDYPLHRYTKQAKRVELMFGAATAQLARLGDLIAR